MEEKERKVEWRDTKKEGRKQRNNKMLTIQEHGGKECGQGRKKRDTIVDFFSDKTWRWTWGASHPPRNRASLSLSHSLRERKTEREKESRGTPLPRQLAPRNRDLVRLTFLPTIFSTTKIGTLQASFSSLSLYSFLFNSLFLPIPH